MATKNSLSHTRTHKLTKVGGKSYVVTLPVEFVRHLKWQEKQKLNVTIVGKRIIIEDWS